MANCKYHTQEPAVYRCPSCGARWCQACVMLTRKGATNKTPQCPSCGRTAEEIPPKLRYVFHQVPGAVWSEPLRLRNAAPLLAVGVLTLLALVAVPASLTDSLWFQVAAAVLLGVVGLAYALTILLHLAMPSRPLLSPRDWLPATATAAARFGISAWPAWLSIGAGVALVLAGGAAPLENHPAARIIVLLGGSYLLLCLLLPSAVASSASGGLLSMFNPLQVAQRCAGDVETHLLLAAMLMVPLQLAAAQWMLLRPETLPSLAVLGPALPAIRVLFLLYLIGVMGAMAGWRAFELGPVLFKERAKEPEYRRSERRITTSEALGDITAYNSTARSPGDPEVDRLTDRISENANDIDAHVELFELYLARNRLADAEKTAGRLMALYSQAKRIDAVAKVYEALRSLNKNYAAPPFILKTLGEYYEVEQRWKSALTAWRDMARHHPDSPLTPRALYRCGVLFAEKLDQRENAIAALRKLSFDYAEDPISKEGDRLLATLVGEIDYT